MSGHALGNLVHHVSGVIIPDVVPSCKLVDVPVQRMQEKLLRQRFRHRQATTFKNRQRFGQCHTWHEFQADLPQDVHRTRTDNKTPDHPEVVEQIRPVRENVHGRHTLLSCICRTWGINETVIDIRRKWHSADARWLSEIRTIEDMRRGEQNYLIILSPIIEKIPHY